MRLVNHPHIPPQVCAATLRGPSLEDGRMWVDTGIDLSGLDPRVYLSQTAVETAARLYDWSPPDVVAELADQIADLERRLADAERQAEDLDGLFNAIDALESAGMRARKKPGRPKTNTKEMEVVHG